MFKYIFYILKKAVFGQGYIFYILKKAVFKQGSTQDKWSTRELNWHLSVLITIRSIICGWDFLILSHSNKCWMNEYFFFFLLLNLLFRFCSLSFLVDWFKVLWIGTQWPAVCCQILRLLWGWGRRGVWLHHQFPCFLWWMIMTTISEAHFYSGLVNLHSADIIISPHYLQTSFIFIWLLKVLLNHFSCVLCL